MAHEFRKEIEIKYRPLTVEVVADTKEQIEEIGTPRGLSSRVILDTSIRVYTGSGKDITHKLKNKYPKQFEQLLEAAEKAAWGL